MKAGECEPLDAELEELLRAERGRPPPGEDVQARVLSRVSATVGGGGGGGGGDHPTPQSPTSTTPPPAPTGGLALGAGARVLSSKLLVLGLGATAITGLAALGISATRGDSSPTTSSSSIGSSSTAPSTASAGPPVEPLPSVASARVETASSATPGAHVAPRPSHELDTSREATLAAERALLDDAQRALGGRRLAQTFALLTRHAQEFPRGRLSEEREGLWIRALISGGRTDEARSRAARFRRLYPWSMLIPSLESTLGKIP